jgi:hypothetical protein
MKIYPKLDILLTNRCRHRSEKAAGADRRKPSCVLSVKVVPSRMRIWTRHRAAESCPLCHDKAELTDQVSNEPVNSE